MNSSESTDPPRDWWDRTTDPQPGDSWYEEPAPRVQKPAAKLSPKARGVVHSFRRQSRKPGGKHREGQRSGDRKIAVPCLPVVPCMVVSVFQRRWRGKYLVTFPWRIRGLAVIAVAMSVPPGTTVQALARMLPRDVLKLSMPLSVWRWVVRWLHDRRNAMGANSDDQPWLTFRGSRGTPRQISWAATRTLDRAGLPGWRLSKLMHSDWGIAAQPVPFETAARRLLSPDSWLWGLAASSRRHRTA